MMDVPVYETALRLFVAVIAGMAIGLNRDLRDKPIGMRTLGLVALGAALVTVATVEFSALRDNPDAISRVVQGAIQGIMAGISFIGAGVILRDAKSRSVEGLTTAATVWVTAALGVACGLGVWVPVAITIVLALALLIGVGWLEHKLAMKEDR
jgi:putative Mg2+ transporter-C (MgtC) family protein